MKLWNIPTKHFSFKTKKTFPANFLVISSPGEHFRVFDGRASSLSPIPTESSKTLLLHLFCLLLPELCNQQNLPRVSFSLSGFFLSHSLSTITGSIPRRWKDNTLPINLSFRQRQQRPKQKKQRCLQMRLKITLMDDSVEAKETWKPTRESESPFKKKDNFFKLIS